MICAQCGTQSASGKFCQQCGNALITSPKHCRDCGETDQQGSFCSNCGNGLDYERNMPNPTQGNPESSDARNRMSRIVWGIVGGLSSLGWLLYMSTPVWGKANPWQVLSLRESQFGGDSGGTLSSYQIGVVITTLLLLGFGAISFYMAGKKR